MNSWRSDADGNLNSVANRFFESQFFAVFRHLIITAIALALPLLNGCNQNPADNTRKRADPVRKVVPGQPRLPTIKLWLGTHEITSELAVRPQERTSGMMHRTNMGTMEGMLFVFNYASQQGFWMKNTLVPLDAAYIDPDGIIREIYPLEPLNETPASSKSADIQYVLEMNQGWFSNHNVRVGMEVRTEKGTLRQTFFGR
jgi:uncharacterized protein